MEAHVLKELDISPNPLDPETITNSAKDSQRSKLQPGRSLLRSFDPLCSSVLETVSAMECQNTQETESPSSSIPVKEELQPNDATDKEDELKKMDETIYLSPLKNVAEIKEIANRQDTISHNITQAVISENTESAEIAKIEVKDAFTQCEVTKAVPNTDEYYELLTQCDFNAELPTIAVLREKQAALQKHVSTLALTFSNAHQKYEHLKTVLEEFHANQQLLKEGLTEVEQQVLTSEKMKEQLIQERLECLETECKQSLSKCNKYETEINELTAGVTKSLEEKTTDCEVLLMLLNELTRN